jgi:pilus assembly protein Flp/PilA
VPAPRWSRLKKLRRADRGATSIEYGLLIALIALGIVGGTRAFNGAIVQIYNNISTSTNTAN